MRALAVFLAFMLAVLLWLCPTLAHAQEGKAGAVKKEDIAYIKEFLAKRLPGATLFSKVTAEHADGADRCIVHLGVIHPSDDAEKEMDKIEQKMRTDIRKLREKAKTDKDAKASLKLAEAVLDFMETSRKRLVERRKSSQGDCVAVLKHLYDHYEVREVFCEGVQLEKEEFFNKVVNGFIAASDARTKIATLLKNEKRNPDQEKKLVAWKKYIVEWEEYWKNQPQHNKDMMEFYAPMTLNRKIRLRAAESSELNDRFFKLTEKERSDPKIEKKAVFDDREDFAVVQMVTKSKQRIVPILFGAAHDFSDNVAAFNKASPKKVSHGRVLPFATLFPF